MALKRIRKEAADYSTNAASFKASDQGSLNAMTVMSSTWVTQSQMPTVKFSSLLELRTTCNHSRQTSLGSTCQILFVIVRFQVKAVFRPGGVFEGIFVLPTDYPFKPSLISRQRC